MALAAESLSSAGTLTIPRVQKVVFNANMGCHDCRNKVSKVLSKIDDLQEYVVDVRQKKVTVKGCVDPNKKTHTHTITANGKKKKAIEVERFVDDGESTHLQKQYVGMLKKVTGTFVQWVSYFRCASS